MYFGAGVSAGGPAGWIPRASGGANPTLAIRRDLRYCVIIHIIRKVN
jgi:hypothetical protein